MINMDYIGGPYLALQGYLEGTVTGDTRDTCQPVPGYNPSLQASVSYGLGITLGASFGILGGQGKREKKIPLKFSQGGRKL